MVMLATALLMAASFGDVPTFSRDIKPLIDRKCITCHVKNGPAPFPLQTYAQVRKRADLCRRMMLTKMMPPCNALSEFGEFCEGGGPLSDEEGVALQQWIDAGAPEGDPTQPAAAPDMAKWRLGKPDAVLHPPLRLSIPEEGRPYWRAIVIPLGKLAGARLRALDIKVDQPEAVRSAVVAIARTGLSSTRRAKEGWLTGGSLDIDAQEYVGAWAHGYPAWELPKGTSMPLDGDALVVQLCVLPRGREESEGFSVALYTSKNSKDRTPKWLHMGQEEFAVPAPGSLVLEPKGELPPGSSVIAVLPEARFFCTSVRLKANDSLLFSTRRWEPYWQGPYRYANPVKLAQGAKLLAEFNYDNDVHMGRNEGRRPRPILAGPRERDELCRLHVLYVRG